MNIDYQERNLFPAVLSTNTRPVPELEGAMEEGLKRHCAKHYDDAEWAGSENECQSLREKR